MAIHADTHLTKILPAGNALCIKRVSSAGGANVALTAAVSGVTFNPTATSGGALLTVGPFAKDVELTIAVAGQFRIEEMWPSVSAAV